MASMPGWAAALHRLSGRAMAEKTGPGGVRLNRAIDLHKVLTGPFVLALMAAFDVWSYAAWVYVGLHGSYGVAWVIKDVTLPDAKWQRRVPWWAAVGAGTFLSVYWIAPVILVLGTAGVIEPEGWAPAPARGLGLAVAIYAVGLVLMVGADAQKNLTLALRPQLGGTEENDGSDGTEGSAAGGGPGGLIHSGFYARVRHPNYLGEMLIYGAFALVVNHWLPWVVLAGVWLLFFLPNMLAIEASLSRYPEYSRWERRTGFLLPAPWKRTGGG